MKSPTNPAWSFWERKQWFEEIDLCVIGSGIVGLNCALSLRKARPNAKILVLERGSLPSGGSTKNAGFACFGSISEVIGDLEGHREGEVLQLASQRVDGIERLMDTLGPESMGYERHGGYEIFLNKDRALFDRCVANIDKINKILAPRFEGPIYSVKKDPFGFANTVEHCVFSPYEGQIDTGKMMRALLAHARQRDIEILNGMSVENFEANSQGVTIQCSGLELNARTIAIASNGFASQLIDEAVKPARAQALITEKLPGLNIKGTFHLDQGYYYFRNFEERILFGGGRNLDIEGETTFEFSTSELIQDRLDALLREVILPSQPVKVEQRWSGIMGVGPQKLPIIKTLHPRAACGVRMCGMGIALGSSVGHQLAQCLLPALA